MLDVIGNEGEANVGQSQSDHNLSALIRICDETRIFIYQLLEGMNQLGENGERLRSLYVIRGAGKGIVKLLPNAKRFIQIGVDFLCYLAGQRLDDWLRGAQRANDILRIGQHVGAAARRVDGSERDDAKRQSKHEDFFSHSLFSCVGLGCESLLVLVNCAEFYARNLYEGVNDGRVELQAA